MTDRIYRTFLGLAMLVALYFELSILLYFLIGMMLLEGLTRFSVPRVIGIAAGYFAVPALLYQPEPCRINYRFDFDGEIMWRMVVALMMLVTYSFYEYVWFFPWFMGFTIFGAGVSGVCPVLIVLHWIGFK